MRAITDRIIAQGFVPIIQGTLKYAYSVSLGGASEAAIAEAAVFAAGVIGRVHACDAEAATTIWDNTKFGPDRSTAGATDFTAVHAAFESVYECMGIDSMDVGCYVDDDMNCKEGFPDPSNPAGGLGAGALIGIIVGGLVGAIVIGYILKKFVCKGKKGKKGKTGAPAAQPAAGGVAA